MQILSAWALETLQKAFDRRVTASTVADFDRDWILLDHADVAALEKLGIKQFGPGIKVAVRQMDRPLGPHIVIQNLSGAPALIVFNNLNWDGMLFTGIRLNGENSTCIFNLEGRHVIQLRTIFLRSNRQAFFFGSGGSAVDCDLISIEGDGALVAIGDDALISRGVKISNFDMHAIVDVATFQTLNRPRDIVLEQHVWIGEDAMLLGCDRVGYGCIVGARTLVKKGVPPKTIVAGVPGRVIATSRSWGRNALAISEPEIRLLRELDALSS